MQPKAIPVVFTPGNEPYLGRELLFHFDQLISSAMEQNSRTASTLYVGSGAGIRATPLGLRKCSTQSRRSNGQNSAVAGRDLTATMNSLLHAKPDSAPWNMVPLGEVGLGHAVSKILNRGGSRSCKA